MGVSGQIQGLPIEIANKSAKVVPRRRTSEKFSLHDAAMVQDDASARGFIATRVMRLAKRDRRRSLSTLNGIEFQQRGDGCGVDDFGQEIKANNEYIT